MRRTMSSLCFFLLLRLGMGLTDFDFEISSVNSNYGDIHPVHDVNHTLLATNVFCLGFSSPSKEQIYFGIFINWKADAQLVWSPPNTHLLNLGSKFSLHENKSLLLQNGEGKTVWQVQGVLSCNITDQGNLLLYNESSIIWESWNNLTDTVLMQQPFNNLSSRIYIRDKVFFVQYGFCNFSQHLDGSIQDAKIVSLLENIYLAFTNKTGVVSSIPLQIPEGVTESSKCFLRLEVRGFSMYCLVGGSWRVQFNDLSQPQYQITNSSLGLNSSFNCPRQDVPWSPTLIISFESLLSALLFFLLSSQILFIIDRNNNPNKKLPLLVTSSFITFTIAITLLGAQEPWIVNYEENVRFASSFGKLAAVSGAFNVLMLHIVNVTLFCVFKTSTHPSKNILIALITFNMLTLLSTHLGIIVLRVMYKTSGKGHALGYFMSPSFLSATNTICLILLRLPGPKWCHTLVRVAVVLASNGVMTFFSSLLALGLGGGEMPNLISPLQQKVPDVAFWICLLVLNIALMLVMAYACHSHQLITKQRIAAILLSILHSVQFWYNIHKKRILVYLVTCLLGRPRPKNVSDDEIMMSLTSYTYEELEVVTNQFSELIGKGGFGGVYKGILLDGKKVAVKKLESNSQGKREFKAEIEILGKVHHMNLAGLLGFCAEGYNRLLVYELMANGSLDRWIFDSGTFLDWPARMKVLVGTARGLAYLHEECDPRIIHLDVKPNNILLDEFFNAKVSDFGLCRILSRDESSLIMTRMFGTMGYLAPEWVHGTVAEKSDVFSFGIVMLEVVSGVRNYVSIDKSFRSWAIERMRDKSFVDSRLSKCIDEAEIRKTIEVALWCTESDPNLRPTMGTVLKVLEGSNEFSPSMNVDSEEAAMLFHVN